MTTAELGQPQVDVKQPDEGDIEHSSVTWAISTALNKPALPPWAANESAACAVKQRDTWQSIEQSSGTDEAIRWIASARFRAPKGERKPADLGTAVHKACETYALEGKRPAVDDEIRPYLDQFDRWLNRFQPEYTAAEVVVFHTRYKFAGQADAFMTLSGIPVICDYKTTKRAWDYRGDATQPFPEVALQLSAYRHAEFAAAWRARRTEKFRRRLYLLNETERALAVPVPEVQGGICLHLTPEHAEAFPVRCDEKVFRTFLHVLECAKWQAETSRTVIGQPLENTNRKKDGNDETSQH